MIDERHEELAALHALGLLEGEGLSAFQTALARDPELRRLVDSLRTSAAELAYASPPAPSPSAALRARILNSAVPVARNDTYVLPFVLPSWLGWAAAACFLFVSVFFAAKSFNVRGELQAVLEAERVARLEAGTLQNLLEAERILSRGQLDRLVAADRQIAELKRQVDIDRLKIASLASLAGNSPQARAIAVWSPDRQEGVLVVSDLPPLQPDKDYQLWVIDPQYPIPVDGGVFTVDEKTGEARLNFRPGKPVATAQTFAVSLERKGGVPKAEGPMVLISQ